MTAAALSAGAALVSILNYTGARASAAAATTAASAERAHRLALTPAADTATSLGDSIPLAALVTDARGAALLGLEPSWSSADPAVAEVDQSGTVVARSPGSTAIIVRVGPLETRARIVVDPRPASLKLADTLLRVPEGERVPVRAEVADARGHPLGGPAVRWSAADPAVAAIDSAGQVHGVTPGRSSVLATLGELRAELPVDVVPVPASITLLDGADQHAAAGSALRLPVVAQIVSRTGRPIAGVEAGFVVRSAGGGAVPAVDTSDARGLVSAVWTLDVLPGRQQLAVVVSGVAVEPVVTAEADPVPANTRVALLAEPGQGAVGEPLADPVVVRVTDSAGAPIPDVPVVWNTPDRGELAAEGARTDSLGEARARWRLGPRSGRQRLRVQVGDPRTLPPLAAAVTATPGDAESLELRGGDGQRARAGAPVARPIVVRVLDRFGNPVPGVLLSGRVDAGKVTDSVLRTDSTGVATVRWTLGRSAGVQRLSLALAGRDGGVQATARAVAGPPAKIAFAAARPAPDSVVVEVSDAYGNPVAGARVTLGATAGTISPGRHVTDRQGRIRARWTAGRKTAAATLTAGVGTLRATRRVTLRPAP